MLDLLEQDSGTWHRMAGLRLPEIESLYADMREYVAFVEEGIGNDPKQSAPLLFDELGFSEAKNETI